MTNEWKSASLCGNSACVEVKIAVLTNAWKNSSLNNGTCVEAREVVGEVQVRDSKDPRGTVLTFDAAAWRPFIEAVKDGDFDLQ